MEVRLLTLSSITPYPDNPRRNEQAVDFVARSIQEYGFRQPIVVDREMVIIAGHTRFFAAQKLGLTEIPVHIAAELSPEQARAYRIADNRSHELAEWDDDKLAEELRQLIAAGAEPANLGFDEQDLRAILDLDATLADEREDDVPELPEEPITQPGDIYQLGPHRLICGDAFGEGILQQLMQNERAAMVFTDPPYNVDYGSSKNPRHHIRTIQNDRQDRSEWTAFCEALSGAIKRYCVGDCYVWGASGPEGMRQRLILSDAGIHWSATIIWKKQQLVLSPAKYQRIYEPCFYGWPEKSSFVTDRTKVEVWEFDRPTKSDLHPTQKPVALCEHGILNSSLPGDLVLDMFLGSGSTLIACEKTKRRCYGVEILPAYCDVIVKRWEEITGQKATRITTSCHSPLAALKKDGE